MKNIKYTKDFLEPLVKDSTSMRELLQKLQLQHTGGNLCHVKKCIKNHSIDYSHFTGQAWRKNKKIGTQYPIEEYLNNTRPINSPHLKNRLLKEQIFERKCQKCGLSKWLNEDIPLELHHIDHKHNNNQLDNLQILCSNCHSIEHKIYAKNKKKSKPDGRAKARPNQRKINRPKLAQLLQDVNNLGYCGTGRKYGVTDNAIRKWIKTYKKYNE